MNRRERRAAVARGQEEPPANYVRTVLRMTVVLRLWLRDFPDQDPPCFALPSRDVFAIAALDEVIDRIARNDAARVLVERFCEIGVEIGGPGAEPTIVMLQRALEVVGLPWGVVPLAELGQFAVLSRGSGGGAAS